MKILFLVYHGFSEHSGISKKIHYQVKGLREDGHDVRLCYYDFSSDNHRCRFVDGETLVDFGTGLLAALRQRIDYSQILSYCIREKIDFVYARCFQNANPWLISFFKKLKKIGIHSVTEIPTYPYDSEFTGKRDFSLRIGLWIDKIFRNRLYHQMDAVVTFSDAKVIFGQKTINISNGVDFDNTPIHSDFESRPSSLHLIGVAEVHYWHGFDRLIAGIGEYYKTGGQRDVYFHLVGGIHPSLMQDSLQAPGLKTLIDKYDISNRIIFYGTLFGKDLDAVFEKCQFAIGSLARHRSGITVIKTLKNREYATRGLPFMYSEQDSDFDNQPYVIKAPSDESPIDIKQIIDFIGRRRMKPIEIRKTVEHLSWRFQMRKVIEFIKS